MFVKKLRPQAVLQVARKRLDTNGSVRAVKPGFATGFGPRLESKFADLINPLP